MQFYATLCFYYIVLVSRVSRPREVDDLFCLEVPSTGLLAGFYVLEIVIAKAYLLGIL